MISHFGYSIIYPIFATLLYKTMFKKIASILVSTRLMAILFLLFALAMAIGTFIEKYYNTTTARIWIYNAWWFEVIIVFFVINFIGNINRYQLLKKEKWATLLLHLAFIFIIVGAFITRYISFEGMMPIREAETTNKIYSDKTFITIWVDGMHEGKMMRRVFEKPLLLSPAVCPPFTSNNFKINGDFDNKDFSVSYNSFMMDAKEVVKENTSGKLFLKMVESGGGTRHEHYLQEGEITNIHSLLFTLNKPVKGAVNIEVKNGKTTINAPFEGSFMRMADQLKGTLQKDVTAELMYRSLYNVGAAQFVFPEQPIKGVKVLEGTNDFKAKNTEDALVVDLICNGKSQKLTLKGNKGKQGEPVIVKENGLEFTLFYGSKVYETPFEIKLNDFIAERYPGTEKTYSSYKSKITVFDGKEKLNTDIYMNHILDYKGYRFFQSSFDPDEMGTVLSANHDFWGTNITYLGYFLLYLGLIAILFTKGSRFYDLKKKLDAIKTKKAMATLVLLFFSVFGLAQQPMAKMNLLDSIKKYKVPEKQADEFGKMVIQDEGGRMKPINTFSSELLRKLSKHDTYEGFDSDQAFLSMLQFPEAWFEQPIIYIKKGNDSIRTILGIDKDQKYARLKDFLDAKGNYKLSPYLDEAARAAEPNSFQKDFLDINKRISLFERALSGSILKVYPIPDDKNNKWVSPLELHETTGTVLDTVRNILPFYLQSLTKGAKSKDYTMANTLLLGLEKYQKKYGAAVRPSDEKIKAEVLYNKYDVFKNLFSVLMITSVVMLLLVISNIFTQSKWITKAINVLHIFLVVLFLVHTLGLVARWYVSGHAPWSNAYESMIYVAWATFLFTLLFDRKSKLTVASGAFVTSMILMIAHWNWMDPEIGNLQPVLNSYWLMIHVAIIVASYGPFTLAMVLGLVAMLLMLFTNTKNKAKMELNIKEITYINEMAVTIGLVMLTIGNFLGGQWANESWGRYWGWDPKETWALISIMVYAFVIHARFVPKLRGLFVYNFMSVLAFASILMTYFGVNFHLTGLHSYATGEKQNVEIYLYIFIGYILFSIFVYYKYKKFYKR